MTTRIDETSPNYRGWRIVVLCFTVAVFSWGFAFYGQSIYLAELQRLHAWSSFTVSTASTMSYLAGAFLVLFTGAAIKRWGPRRFLLGGVSCLALAVVFIGQARASWQIYPAYLLMAMGWSAMNVVAITTLIALWFDTKRGLAISLALNGASFGGIAWAPVLLSAIGHVGLEIASLAGSAIMLVVLVPMILAWGSRPPPSKSSPRTDASVSHATNDSDSGTPWTRMRALHSPAFWSLSGPFALALFAQVGFLVHLVAILEPTIGRASAGLAISIVSITAVVGRVGLGFVIDSLNMRRASALSMASQAVALLLIGLFDDRLVLLSACALFGLSVGNLITLPALIVQKEFDKRAFPLIVGLSTAIGQVTYAFGPGLIGLLRDTSGSYSGPVFLCTALLTVAAAVVLMPQKRPGHLQ